jgi:tRNA (cmo5U34)-methyltransferase
MDSPQSENENTWTEDVSRDFLDYGSYIVPDPGHQMQVMISLLADLSPNATVLELCCGEGLLAEKILERYTGIHLKALDGSLEMLKRARERLTRFENQTDLGCFNLASTAWRSAQAHLDCVISSLAIHHLPGLEKLALFRDVYRMLAPGGIFVIADIVEVVGTAAKHLAADEWDRVVHQQSLEKDSNLNAYDFFIREGWNMHRYLDPQDIDKPSPLFDQLQWLDESGFVEINICWLLAGHAVFCARKPAATSE